MTTTDKVLHVLGDIMLVIASISFIGFVVSYWFLADWRSSKWGRAVMRFHSGIAIIMTYILWARFVGPLPGKEWIRFITLTIVAYLGLQQLWMMLKAQLHGRRGKHDVD